MERKTNDLWSHLLGRLGLPDDASVDAVHAALGDVVGRGTVQRMRQGGHSFSLTVIGRIAQRLGCDVTDLLSGRYEAPRVASVSEPETKPYFSARARIDQEGVSLAHSLSYTPVTVPYLSREELMAAKELPQTFRIDLPDDALGARAPKGTPATFERRPADWGDAVLLFDTKGQPHIRVYRQSLEHEWEGVAPHPAFATFNGSMPGVRVVAVLESLGGGWAQLSR